MRFASARRSASARSTTSFSRSGTTSGTPSRRFAAATSGISASRSSIAASSARSGSAVAADSSPSHSARHFASEPSASRASSQASKSAASSARSARTSQALRSRESGPIRVSGTAARASQCGASAPSVTTASTRSAASCSITASLSGTAIERRVGKRRARHALEVSARVHGDPDLGPVERGLAFPCLAGRASANACVSATATVNRPAADRSGRTVIAGGRHVEAARLESRPASCGQRKLTNASSRPRSFAHARISTTSNPSGAAPEAPRTAERGVVSARPDPQRRVRGGRRGQRERPREGQDGEPQRSRRLGLTRSAHFLTCGSS